MDRDFVESVLEEVKSNSNATSYNEFLVEVFEYFPEEYLEDEDFEELIHDLTAEEYDRIEEEKKGEEEDEDLLQDGQCEMCERVIPLTRHHLIPRRMHNRYKKKGYTTEFLNTCAMICRACHSCCHRVHSHEVLASQFNTVEKLMGDEEIARFVRWVAKTPARTRRMVRS